MPTRIYTLNDPRTDEIRYVGKTSSTLQRRLGTHISHSALGSTHSKHWIQSLLQLGYRPTITLVETVPDNEDWQAREQHWIAYHHALGTRLTNLTDGGEGNLGWHHSDQTRTKISNTRIARGLGKDPNLAKRLTVALPKVPKSTKSLAWYTSIQKSNTGACNGQAKLTEGIAQQIKVEATKGDFTYQQIANVYGVSRTLVGMIRRGDRWSHLPNLEQGKQ